MKTSGSLGIVGQNLDNTDHQVKFQHPPGPSIKFYWSSKGDTCGINHEDIMCS
jgi:hypothetical protein